MNTIMNEQPPQGKKKRWDYLLILRWGLAFIFLVGPAVYLAVYPASYTPLVQFLISIFLFLLAYWIGFTREAEAAARRANDRWLPQAESVIYRLMTLRTNVRGFSRTTKATCSCAASDLPELEKPEFKAVKIKMKADCDASGQRLDDIAHQLEDAIEDWRRFIIMNCQGEECARIWEALLTREDRLEREFQGKAKPASMPESTSSIDVGEPIAPAQPSPTTKALN
jgi:hypothetical protein